MMCASLLVLANMRAAALASAMMVALYMIMFSTVYRQSFKYAKYMNRFAIVLLVFLVFFGTVVGLQNISADFAEVAIDNSSDMISGESLNRLGPWQAGLTNLSERSWIIGYGHGTTESNRLAWGGLQLSSGRFIGGGHFHNLYLALPTLYGWLGSIAYVCLFFTIVFRLYRSVRKYSFDRVTVVLALGLLVSSGLFLLDEIKSGHAVQYFNLPMLFFIWFGLGLATVRTIKADFREMRRPRPEIPHVESTE